MTTDLPTGPGPDLALEAQAQLYALHRLILKCQRSTDEANLLVRQSAHLVEASRTCLNHGAASPAGPVRRSG